VIAKNSFSARDVRREGKQPENQNFNPGKIKNNKKNDGTSPEKKNDRNIKIREKEANLDYYLRKLQMKYYWSGSLHIYNFSKARRIRIKHSKRVQARGLGRRKRSA